MRVRSDIALDRTQPPFPSSPPEANLRLAIAVGALVNAARRLSRDGYRERWLLARRKAEALEHNYLRYVLSLAEHLSMIYARQYEPSKGGSSEPSMANTPTINEFVR